MGKDDSANQAAGQAAQAQTQLAQKLVGQTDPLRAGLINDAEGFLTGGRDVSSLPEFGAFKDSAESQFGRAKDNIIANTPEGGGLIAALTNLEGNRASNQAAFTGDLAGNEIQRALQLATFGAAAGNQGLGQAGFIQTQRAAAEAQQNAAKSGAAGDALGNVVALALK